MSSFVQLLLLVLNFITIADEASPPNVVFFMTDDWGFNDVGYHRNTATKTPFIDALAQDDGLIIEKYYAYPLCTITRCALLTGRYAMRYGMQDEVIDYESNYALSKRETLLAEEFQHQGYTTHIIGKWHLGMLTWEYTPTYRGFDTFLGYYGNAIYYYEHLGIDNYYTAYDFRQNTEKHDEPHRYSLNIWADEAENIIQEASLSDTPFFLYLAWQGSHSPSQSLPEDLAMYTEGLTATEINSSSHRLEFQAQTTTTDGLLMSIVGNLKTSGVWNNTIIVFVSDNGGDAGYGDNSPLRGAKKSIWEGGIRLPAFVTGGWLPERLRGKLFDSYPIHVTDWYPSLLSAAGLEVTKTKNPLDGKNIWKLLMTASKSSRTSYDASIANGIEGSIYDSSGDVDVDGVRPERVLNAVEEIGDRYDGSVEELVSLTDSRMMLINVDTDSCVTDICGALIYGGRWKIIYGTPQVTVVCGWERTFEESSNDILGCGELPSDVDQNCTCSTEVCLFDLLNDPCEYYEVSDEHPLLTEKLYLELETYYDLQVAPLAKSIGDISTTASVDPTNADGSMGYWGPWCTTPWEELEFEELIESYYNGDGSTSGSSTTDYNYEKEEEDARAHVRIGNNNRVIMYVSVVSLGILLFGIYFWWLGTTINGGNSKLESETNNNNKVVSMNETTPLIKDINNSNCNNSNYIIISA